MSDPEDRDDLSDVSDIDPESTILQPVQRRIEEQLRRNLEQLTLNFHEASNEARMMRQKREDCGVELYNVQQHLAKLQEGLERGHENYVAIHRLRDEREAEKAVLSADVQQIEARNDELRKKYFKFQTELDKLSDTLLKVEQFNDQIQSEIQIERTSAYKAENEITRLERRKANQDRIIDQMNERVRTLTEQHASLSAQLAAQKSETKMARETLAEALSEMEAISFEKKQLLQQWKSSIIGMQRRDEALRATDDALTKQSEELMTLDNEIVGYKQGIKSAQQKNAKLSHLLSKTESEVATLERQIDAMLDRKTKATERFTVLKKSLEQTDGENRSLEGETRVLTAELETISKRTHKAVKEVHDLEAKVLETLNKQTTLKKGSQSALLDIEKMKNVIRDKEMHVTHMENELARIRVDTLQTQAHNDVLKQTVGELEKELTARDTLIEKMQLDIRRRHDEIERKQKQLDALNRQFEAIVASQGSDGGEHVGPLEATINNLSKSITQKSSENDALQRDWIKLQTELVNSKNYNQQLHDTIRDLKSQCTILTQKRNRLVNSTKLQRKEISDLDRTTQQLHLEMKRLNTLVQSNDGTQEDLANDNFNLENDLVKRLLERKREAVQLESKIDLIREAKAELLSTVVEAERDVMFWEKKIQLANETALALDPTAGKEELIKMKKEIYIMEQRLANLQREQRRKVEEMQKLIEHRDVLRTKGQAIQAASKNGQKGVTKATVNKENTRLVQELNEKQQEAQLKDHQIRECLQNTERTASEVDNVVQETARLRHELGVVQQNIDIKSQERNRAADEKARKQRTLQRFRDAEKGLYKLATFPEEIARERQALELKQRAIALCVQEVITQFPHLAAELGQVTSAL
jgi:chromosome segregation ATPase